MKKKKDSLEDDLKSVFGDFEVIDINVGDRVVCDGCNDEYTESNEIGGILLSRSAFCPKCAVEIIVSAKKYHEEKFLTYPLPEETFKDFVLRIR